MNKREKLMYKNKIVHWYKTDSAGQRATDRFWNSLTKNIEQRIEISSTSTQNHYMKINIFIILLFSFLHCLFRHCNRL